MQMPGTFEELDVYGKARGLRQRVFRLARQLPREERFVLVPKLRRAALSVTNNIAEGHGSHNWKQEISHLCRARGSVNEIIDDLGACEDEDHFKAQRLADLRADADEVIRPINGYISHLQRQLDQYMQDNRLSRRKPPRKAAQHD
jgi:four helix bundle protein